jgi:hypothetical protein
MCKFHKAVLPQDAVGTAVRGEVVPAQGCAANVIPERHIVSSNKKSRRRQYNPQGIEGNARREGQTELCRRSLL